MSLYHEAAELLTAPTTEGGSLKSRVFRNKKLKSQPNQLYALVLETRKWSLVLKEVIENAELLKYERKLSPALSLLLVHDLLLAKSGIALPQSHGLRSSIERHKGRLTAELTRARLRRKASSLEALKDQVERDSAGEEANYPRWVRVNALKSTVEEQLETTFAKYTRAANVQEVITSGGRRILIDPHVPNLIAVTSGVDLSKTEAYTTGKIILQDKASCFPAYLLDPQAEDGDVVDACAAPGNKTTHLAAIIHEHQPEFESPRQKIYAFEKDARRAKTLEKMIKIAGSRTMTQVGFGQDFLQVNPQSDKFSSVGALLLDPSCSGSGIVGRDSLPELFLPASPDPGGNKKPATTGNDRKRKSSQLESDDAKVMVDDDGNETVLDREKDYTARLEALASFQLELLLHAFQFPGAKKVTYSTCSIHAQENEQVVLKALSSPIARERGWQILLRKDQVRGMQEWPVRGVDEACQGNNDVAEACIRSYKDDGHGVMGFFVAAFHRKQADEFSGSGSDVDGPYLRDERGAIVRDMMGMPVLRSTGQPVELNSRQAEVAEGTHAEPFSGDNVNESSMSDGDSSEEVSESPEDSESESDEGEEWDGFAD